MTPSVLCPVMESPCVVLAAKGPGRASATDVRQGKSASPAAIQALVRACLSPCRPVGRVPLRDEESIMTARLPALSDALCRWAHADER